MHHVHDDKRTRRSARALAEALSEMLPSMPLDKITVTALCKRAKVARTTFYRSFDHVEDVVSWHLEMQLLETAWRLPKVWPTRNRESIIRKALVRWHSEKKLLRTLACDHRLDLLESAFIEMAYPIMQKLKPQERLEPLSCRTFARVGGPFVSAMVRLWFSCTDETSQVRWTDAFVRGFTTGVVPGIGSGFPSLENGLAAALA